MMAYPNPMIARASNLAESSTAPGGISRTADGGRWRLERLRAEIDDELARFVHDGFARFRASPVLGDLVEETGRFVVRPGKRIRPLLFLLGTEAFGSGVGGPRTASRSSLVRLSCSLELLHAFILIHDDIIDRSELRRGQPTLHRLAGRGGAEPDLLGRNLAIVLGDLLFALAQRALVASSVEPEVRTELGQLLVDYLVDTGFGELADIQFAERDLSEVSRADIEEMYWLKTTRYTIECPLVMAATLSRLPPSHRVELGEIAKPLGLAFQIHNDLKEYRRSAERTEPPGDVVEGKKTILLREAFDRLGETDRSLLRLSLAQSGSSRRSWPAVRELIDKSRAPEALEAETLRLVAAGRGRIADSAFAPSQKAALADFVSLLESMLG